jgi:hypothetical protein
MVDRMLHQRFESVTAVGEGDVGGRTGQVGHQIDKTAKDWSC